MRRAGELILNQFGVPGAWSQPEEDERRKRGQGRSTDPQPIWGFQVEKDGGEDKAGALILNQYRDPGARRQPEEDGGGDKAGALILNQYGGPRCVWPERLSSTNMGSQVRGLNLKKTEDGSEDKAAALILNQYGGFRLRKTEVRTRPERLSSTNMGVQVRGVNLKKTEAQPIWGSQVRMAGALIINQYGVPGVWSQPEKTEDGSEDKAAALILIQYRGFRLRKTEVRTRPERLSSTNMGASGAWCHSEEDGGGDKAGAPILNQYGGPRYVVFT